MGMLATNFVPFCAPKPTATNKPSPPLALRTSSSASTSSTMVPEPCVFCNVSEEKGFKIIYEDASYSVFRDRSPGSKVHLLAVPKRHIDNVKTLTKFDLTLMKDLALVGTHALDLMGVPRELQSMGFHIPPFYSINHLHLHLLSLPLPFPSSLKYCPTSSSPLLPPLTLHPLTEPLTPPTTSAPLPFSHDPPTTSEMREYRRMEFPNANLNTNRHSGQKVLDEEEDDFKPLTGGKQKEGGKWIKAKGWCWFIGLDQAIAIVKSGQRVKVGSVKVPLIALTADDASYSSTTL